MVSSVRDFLLGLSADFYLFAFVFSPQKLEGKDLLFVLYVFEEV